MVLLAGQSPERDFGLLLLTFAVGDATCALPSRAIREVVPMALLSRPPGLPSIVEGLLNLGGVAIPVVSFKRLFKMEGPPPGLYAHVIVLRGETPLAFLVDYVKGAVEVSESALVPVRGERTFNECVEAEVMLDGCTVSLMAADKLLLLEERLRIREFCDTKEERLGVMQEPPT